MCKEEKWSKELEEKVKGVIFLESEVVEIKNRKERMYRWSMMVLCGGVIGFGVGKRLDYSDIYLFGVGRFKVGCDLLDR